MKEVKTTALITGWRNGRPFQVGVIVSGTRRITRYLPIYDQHLVTQLKTAVQPGDTLHITTRTEIVNGRLTTHIVDFTAGG